MHIRKTEDFHEARHIKRELLRLSREKARFERELAALTEKTRRVKNWIWMIDESAADFKKRMTEIGGKQ